MFDELTQTLRDAQLPAHQGYATTGAKPPYVVVRPMTVLPGELNLDGMPTSWDNYYGIYCVGASVSASLNLSAAVVRTLQGRRVAGEVLSCSVGYSGAKVEGQYETQVTIQAYRGEI